MHSVRRLVTASLVAGALALAIPAPSDAKVADNQPLESTTFNGVVRTVVHRGSTIYIGGNFTKATDASGTVSRLHVAAISASSGQLLAWNPKANGTVYGLAVGKKAVFIGGDFTRVRGKAVKNLAKVKSTGPGYVWKKFHHKFNNTVRAVAIGKTRVYVGGSFSKADGKSRLRLAAFTRKGHGTLVKKWHPNATHAAVNRIRVVKEGIFLAGQFWKINGEVSAQRIALVRKTNGHLIKSFDAPAIYDIFDFSVTAHRVYVAMGGPGGYAVAYNRKTGHQIWKKTYDGDVQAITVLSGVIYPGGHYSHLCRTDNTGPTGNCIDSGATVRHKLSGLTVSGALTTFDPDVNRRLGVLAMDALPAKHRLAVGGAFTAFENNTVPRQRFALFAS